MRSAQSQRRRFIFRRNRFQRGFTDIDYRRQYHNRQYDYSGNQVRASGKLMCLGTSENKKLQFIHQGIQNHNPQQTIDNRRNSRQQFNSRLYDRRQPLGRHFCQKYSGQNANRHTDKNRKECTYNTCKNDIKNTETGFRRRRAPYRAEQNIQQAHFKQRRRSVDDHI